MALIASFLLSAVLVYGAYALVRYRAAREAYWKNIKKDPLREVVVFVFIGGLMVFFWGILIPPVGGMTVRFTRSIHVTVWQLGGIIAVVGLVLVDLPRFRK